MKKILLFLLLLAFSTIHAQNKLSFKKKKFYIPTIAYSQYPILDNVLTQTTFFQLDSELREEEIYLKKKYFSIDGYLKDPVAGKLKIYITIPIPKHKKTYIDSTYNDKIHQWQYYSLSRFEVKINVEVKCADKVIFSNEFITAENYKPKGGYQKAEAKQALETNEKRIREAELSDDYSAENLGVSDVIYASMDRIQVLLNQKLGYYTKETKEKFEFVTSKEHPEYLKMLDFENEITAQIEKVTLENGFNEKRLLPHLAYLEGLLDKYLPIPENTAIRFVITNNLALTYLLLENKEKALYFADLLIKNDKQESRGTDIIDRVTKANLIDKKVRAHSNRFAELKKLGFKILEEKEDARLAFFEKIDRQELDWELEKSNRIDFLEKSKRQRDAILDSINYQKNPDLLAKIINNLGGVQALKNIEKAHVFSKLSLEDSNVPQTEEKWATATNYLLKKKMPETYYEIVNGPESWSHDDRESGVNAKWKKLSISEYSNLLLNLDPINLLASFRLDLWNKYELLEDEVSAGQICYHLTYFEKKLNSSNRMEPKTEYHLFIDKEKFNLVSTERTEFEDGNKSFFERKIFKDYLEIPTLNMGKIPHKIIYEIEDYYGDTFYKEQREKIEINPTFSNRIFIKEVYFGSFK
jgi:hypothetical protein